MINLSGLSTESPHYVGLFVTLNTLYAHGTYIDLLVFVTRVSMHPTNVITVTLSKSCSLTSRGLDLEDGRWPL